MSIALLTKTHYKTVMEGVNRLANDRDVSHSVRIKTHEGSAMYLQDMNNKELNGRVLALATLNAKCYMGRYMRTEHDLFTEFGVRNKRDALRIYMKDVRLCKKGADVWGKTPREFWANLLKALQCITYQIELEYLDEPTTEHEENALLFAEILEQELCYLLAVRSDEYKNSDTWMID